MNEKKVRVLKMKKLNDSFITTNNDSIFQKNHHTSPLSQSNQEDKEKKPQKIKDLLQMIKEPPKINLQNEKINKMCQLYPEFMNNKFNQQYEIQGGTNPSDFEKHLNQLRMDSFDDMKIEVEQKQEQLLNNQFNYLYVYMPPPSNKLNSLLTQKNQEQSSNKNSNRKRHTRTSNYFSSKSSNRTPDDSIINNDEKNINESQYSNEQTKESYNQLDINSLNMMKQNDTFINKQQRSNTEMQDQNEKQFQIKQNSFALNRSEYKLSESNNRKNLSTGRKRNSDNKNQSKTIKLDEIKQSQNSLIKTADKFTIPPLNTKGLCQQELNQNILDSSRIKFMTEPTECFKSHQTNSIINNQETQGQELNILNKQTNNNVILPQTNLRKKEMKEIAEWRYIEFVHKRRSLSLTPNCQKVNQIIKKKQEYQAPKNCSLNAKIQESQLQSYYDQYLLTAKPATPTKIKEIRERLVISKQILNEQEMENKSQQKKKIEGLLTSLSPSSILTQHSDDPAFFLKNRLSPSKINYKEKRMIQNRKFIINEVIEEENQVKNTPIVQFDPQISLRQSTIYSKLKQRNTICNPQNILKQSLVSPSKIQRQQIVSPLHSQRKSSNNSEMIQLQSFIYPSIRQRQQSDMSEYLQKSSKSSLSPRLRQASDSSEILQRLSIAYPEIKLRQINDCSETQQQQIFSQQIEWQSRDSPKIQKKQSYENTQTILTQQRNYPRVLRRLSTDCSEIIQKSSTENTELFKYKKDHDPLIKLDQVVQNYQYQKTDTEKDLLQKFQQNLEEEEDDDSSKKDNDNEEDDDTEEDDQKVETQKSKINKDIMILEQQAKEQIINSPDNIKKQYQKQTISSKKQKKISEFDCQEEKRSKSVGRSAFNQINTILNACEKVNAQNKIDNKLFQRVHKTVNKNNKSYLKYLPMNQENDENFEEEVKEIIRDEKLHEFLKQQMIRDIEESLKIVEAARTQSQLDSQLSKPKDLITFVKNNILDSVIRNPAYYNQFITDSRKKKLKDNKIKIKSYVNQQDKDMTKLVKYSDLISFK